MDTNFKKIEKYYNNFNEWDRLNSPAGELEFDIVINILSDYLGHNQKILDLGGGPGRYTFYLASKGHNLWLADISPGLISEAKKRCSNYTRDVQEKIKKMMVLNALDLKTFKDNMFDCILLFGPLYHLNSEEIKVCLHQVNKKIKKNGFLFSIFMPYEVGLKSILQRYFNAPNQVDSETLELLSHTGKFTNKIEDGFQEGYFYRTNDMLKLHKENNFKIEQIRSIRGIAYENESEIIQLKKTNMEKYQGVINYITNSAQEESVINTGGHSIIIAKAI